VLRSALRLVSVVCRIALQLVEGTTRVSHRGMRLSITLASYKESYVTYVTTVTCRRANDRALTTGHRWSLGEADGGAPGAEQPNEHDRGKIPNACRQASPASPRPSTRSRRCMRASMPGVCD
jgi:hypothetical protein